MHDVVLPVSQLHRCCHYLRLWRVRQSFGSLLAFLPAGQSVNRHDLETSEFVRKFEAPKRCQSHARALKAIADRIDHAGRLRISHAQLGRVLGLCERQTQTIVHALERAGVLRIVAQRGFANVYRVLVDWVLRLIAGESVAGSPVTTPDPHAASPQPRAASSPPDHPPPWVFARYLEGHPEL